MPKAAEDDEIALLNEVIELRHRIDEIIPRLRAIESRRLEMMSAPTRRNRAFQIAPNAARLDLREAAIHGKPGSGFCPIRG